ncbi:Uncharacterised protein [Burkholderia cenocepacia]|nr:Uncharacterised protein [Burkholderia cenocepacia]
MRGDALHRALDALTVRIDDPVAMQLDIGDVAVLQVGNAIGNARQRNRVGRQKILAFADPDDERHPVARADDPVRLVAAHHRDRIAAAQSRDRAPYRVEQVAVVQVVDQVRDRLAVGLAREHIAMRLQFRAQLIAVFDDPVVRQRDARIRVARREVRMRVERDGRAMRGPARMRDARVTGQRQLGDLALQVRDAIDAAGARQCAVAVDHDAARIVAAVFEPLQAVDEVWQDVPLGNRPDNSTHIALRKCPVWISESDGRAGEMELNFKKQTNMKQTDDCLSC